MAYKRVYKNAVIESIKPEALQRRYQQFLDTLTDHEDRIVSVNYQTAVTSLEGENWNSTVLYSIVVTHSSVEWVDTGSGEVKNQ
jgi:hypothetical protein